MNLFSTNFNRKKNILDSYTSYIKRKISDMEGYFQAENIRKKILLSKDSIVYKVYMQDVPLKIGELLHCVTIIQTGDIDGEFFMTKGHYHIDRSCAEIYYGQKGRGLLLLQKGKEKSI